MPERLLDRPAIELLRRVVPIKDARVQVQNGDGVVGDVQQGGLLAEALLGPLALGQVLQAQQDHGLIGHHEPGHRGQEGGHAGGAVAAQERAHIEPRAWAGLAQGLVHRAVQGAGTALGPGAARARIVALLTPAQHRLDRFASQGLGRAACQAGRRAVGAHHLPPGIHQDQYHRRMLVDGAQLALRNLVAQRGALAVADGWGLHVGNGAAGNTAPVPPATLVRPCSLSACPAES